LPELQGPITLAIANAPTGSKYYVNDVEYSTSTISLAHNGTYSVEVRRSDNCRIAGATFKIVGVTEPAAAPTFSPAGPYISKATSVAISCATVGASIYYTTNRDTPTTSSTKYTNSVEVTSGTTLKAIAIADGYSQSTVTSQTYTILTGVTFSGIDGAISWVWVEGEEYTTLSGGFTGAAGLWCVSGYSPSLPANQVNVSGYATYDVNLPMTMAGAKMYAHCSSYYIDGSDRSFLILSGDSDGDTIGTIYSSGGSGEGYKDAIYWAQNGWDMGTFAQGAMQLTLSQGVYNIMCFDGFFLTNGTVDISNNAPVPASDSTGRNWMQRPTFTGTLPELQGPITLAIANAPTGSKYYVNDVEYSTSDITLNRNGTYSVEVRRSDNCRIAGASFKIVGLPDPAEAPVFTPSGPFISIGEKVSITCATEGASIYYTLDGSVPSETNGTLYTGIAVKVDDGKMLRAVAVKTGYLNSVVNRETYYVKTIPVLAWLGIPDVSATPARFQELREAGFTHNYAWYSADWLPYVMNYAVESGIKMIVPPMVTTVSSFVEQFKDHPALEAYYLQDEPSASLFSSLATQVEQIQSLDPNHWCYINLFPITASSSSLGTSSYESYVNSYLSTVPTQVLSFDIYPVMEVLGVQIIQPQYYNNLEVISSKAKAAGIPFWAFALSTAHGVYPVPTLTHLRFQVFSNLAYGAQGIQYFTYWQPTDTSFHDAPINANGEKTSTWYVVQSMNKEIKGISPVFLGATVDSVGHTGTPPAGTTAYTASAPINNLTTSGSDGAVVSRLTNGSNEYLVVVNRDLDSTMTLTVTVDTSKNFSVVSKNGTKTALTSETASFTVNPADIVVLNWGTSTLAVTPSSRSVTVDAGTTSFAVSNSGGSTMSWSAQVISGSSWVSITDGSSGTNDGTINVSYAANTSTSRTATIRITATGSTNTSIDVTIVQAATASTPGDFNGDGKINAKDIDLLSAAINSHSTNYDTYDLTNDDTVNSADMDVLVKDILKTYYGDADLNGSVGVSDLSVLAAYYNTASGASWANGDFDGNGAVGVSDLSILAANYNSGSTSTISWAEAYAQAFGTTSDADETVDDSSNGDDTSSTICSSLGLSLIAGLAMLGLAMVKLEE
jgi:hypothetical protein